MPMTGKKVKQSGQPKAVMLKSSLMKVSCENNQCAASKKIYTQRAIEN